MNKEKLIYYYLIIITKIKLFFLYIKRFITDTKDVQVITKSGKRENALVRYYILRLINYLIWLLDKIKKLFDVDVKMVQITKDLSEGEKTFIVDSNDVDSLDNVVQYVCHKKIKRDDTLGKHVFLKFELHNKNDREPLCMKKFLTKYRDNNKQHKHTLENILLFNDIAINKNDTNLNITFFKDGMLRNKQLPYERVRDYHISDFFEFE